MPKIDQLMANCSKRTIFVPGVSWVFNCTGEFKKAWRLWTDLAFPKQRKAFEILPFPTNLNSVLSRFKVNFCALDILYIWEMEMSTSATTEIKRSARLTYFVIDRNSPRILVYLGGWCFVRCCWFRGFTIADNYMQSWILFRTRREYYYLYTSRDIVQSF